MPAYCLFDNLEVHDPEALEEYKRKVAPIVARYGGRYLVIGGPFRIVEGTWGPTFPVMLEFPTMEDAERWYSSEEYRELKEMRLRAVRSNAVFIEGL